MQITWFAVFWIRLIKKGIHFGWRMIKKITGTEVRGGLGEEVNV